jgi:hypothetical protein
MLNGLKNCLTSCPLKTYKVSKPPLYKNFLPSFCDLCSIDFNDPLQYPCDECSEVSKCTKCTAPSYVDILAPQNCVACDVFSTQVEDLVREGNYCKRCHGSCKSCFRSDSTSCLTCHAGKVLALTSQCVEPFNLVIAVAKAEFTTKQTYFEITFNHPVNILKVLKNSFKITLKDSEGKEKEYKLTRAHYSGSTLVFRGRITEKITNGSFTLISENDAFYKYMHSPQRILDLKNNPNAAPPTYSRDLAIYSVENLDNVFMDTITVPNVNYDPSSDASMNNIGAVSKGVFKSANGFVLLISIPAAVLLIKLFQMNDFMLLLSVN